MKKSKLESVIKLVPDTLKTLGEYFKNSTNDILKGLSNNTGAVGLAVKIFSQPLIDGYFKKQEANKLENFGLNTYLKASLNQVNISLENSIDFNSEYDIDALKVDFKKIIVRFIENSEHSDLTLFFQPKYHPIVQEVEKLATEF